MQDSPITPAPPNLAGIIWRPITDNDLAKLTDLAKTCYHADGGLHFLFEPDEIARRYFPDAPIRSIGAFATDGRLVACNSVYLTNNSETQIAMSIGQVHPHLRNRGIGSYLMHWSQTQAQALLANTAVAQPVMRIRTESLTTSANHLYQAHGFELIFEEHVMRRDLHQPLPDHTIPADITISRWQPDLAEPFFQVYDAAFRERPGFPGWTRDEWVDGWTNDHFRPDWSLLARTDDIPLGFLTAATNPPHGFIIQVGVIPRHRRRGLCSGLMVETMRRMHASGAVSMQLTVNVNNPGAIKAYAALGFETIGHRARYERTITE